MAKSLAFVQWSRWRPQKKKSVACTSINHKPLSTSLRGNEEETNVFNSILNQPDGASFSPDHERNPRSDAGCAGKQDQRNDRPAPTGFTCQQPQKQDEAYAARTYACKNELSYSEVTPGKELFRHPAVEQLAKTGRRSAILEQDHQKSSNNLRFTCKLFSTRTDR